MDRPLANRTFGTARLLSGIDAAAPAALTLIVKGTFDLHPGKPATPAAKQLPLVGADEHTAEPGVSAVRYESDFVPFKPRADVLCVGKAHAPRGRPVTELEVHLAIGPVKKTIRVIGDRVWERALAGLSHRIGAPAPFVTMPVSYDRAFGGKDAGKPEGFRFYEANRVGRGYTRSNGALAGLALPNLEDPADPVRHARSRPAPVSFGPVGRTWEPRVRCAGTYSQRWLKTQAPALPDDFDLGFYNCAPADQQIPGYLRGDEELVVRHMHPQHAEFRGRLPGVRVRAFVERRGGLNEVPMNLDTAWIDMEALTLALVWRGRLAEAPPDEAARLLIVDEPLAEPPREAGRYLPLLRRLAAEEAAVDQEAEEAEREVAAMDRAGAAPAPAPAS
jgi:hypothetical protein